ncbi:hypothetical protein [Pseudoduganella lutea]|uniref:Uncharacterized protein n=1 Tax=Pseudoduganella lutea TaxID=321985 RepID=A0A4P6L303_9BURK|nr:hypothetical protein [Pseudoduganella lutea]QBE65817.1 hypothetical protein EWM63_24910 [Pseudoduganella lutea]
MIYSVNSSSNEVTVGQPFSVEVIADSALHISISCFVDSPPPPRFKGCRECSVHIVQSGQPFTITPKRDTWLNHQGGYSIEVRDADGNTENLVIRVSVDTDATGGATISM